MSTDLIEPLFALWTDPPVDDAAALAAFRDVYHDPVTVNGSPIAAADLLVRARQVNQAYSELRVELIDVVTAPGRLVVAFQMLGTHTGQLATPLGTVAPTGRPVRIRTIDVLTLDGGRISDVVVVGDELGTLISLGAVALASG
jgi:predicted ester cyclase